MDDNAIKDLFDRMTTIQAAPTNNLVFMWATTQKIANLEKEIQNGIWNSEHVFYATYEDTELITYARHNGFIKDFMQIADRLDSDTTFIKQGNLYTIESQQWNTDHAAEDLARVKSIISSHEMMREIAKYNIPFSTTVDNYNLLI